MKILIVDDANVNRYVFRKYILKYDPTIIIEEACNGNEGYQKAILENYDIIFMDVVMPYKNGIDTSREIIQKKPNQYIICISGLVDQETIDLMKKVGIENYITKPVGKGQIFQLLDHYKSLH